MSDWSPPLYNPIWVHLEVIKSHKLTKGTHQHAGCSSGGLQCRACVLHGSSTNCKGQRNSDVGASTYNGRAMFQESGKGHSACLP